MLSAILLQPATSKYATVNTRTSQMSATATATAQPQHSHSHSHSTATATVRLVGSCGHDNRCSASGPDIYFGNAPKCVHPSSAGVISVYLNVLSLYPILYELPELRKFSHCSGQPAGSTNRGFWCHSQQTRKTASYFIKKAAGA